LGILIWAIIATGVVVVLGNKVIDLQEDIERLREPQETIVDSGAPYKAEPMSQTIKEEQKTNYFYE
jgi:hypothetical protein